MRFLVATVLLAACAPSDPPDITGPFTGPVHRYVVDRIDLATSSVTAHDLGDDLDGDGSVDNQAGAAIATLIPFDDITTHGPDMIASGTIASVVTIQADDLGDDDAAAVVVAGIATLPASPVGAAIVDGRVRSNRTRDTAAPVSAAVRLPVFADADPLDVVVIGLELELVPDGAGGYDGTIHGGIPRDGAIDAAADGILQMLAAAPDRHQVMARILDHDLDGTITRDEITTDELIGSLLASDLKLFDQDVISIGFGVHLAPCEAGRCATPVASCFDRVRDGDETDLDCGGSCGACPAAAACVADADCRAAQCVEGTCAAPSCSDGVRDGFETDVDCGVFCSPALCDPGRACHAETDCKSGSCAGSTCQ